MSQRVLYLVVCAAGPASRIDIMVKLAQNEGWSVYCLATPAAVEHFLDVVALAELTGHPVRSTYRSSDSEALPLADAIIVAPATYNTINKWAAGIADNYVLTQLAELTGIGARIVVLPFINQALAANLCSPAASTISATRECRSCSDQANSNPTHPAPAATCSTTTPGGKHWTRQVIEVFSARISRPAQRRHGWLRDGGVTPRVEQDCQ